MFKVNIGIELLGANPRAVKLVPKFEFKDGQRKEQIGYVIEVILSHAGFEKLRVTVPDLTLPITDEDIEERNNRFDPIKVHFEGFTASPYVDKSGKIAYSAKADKVTFPGFKKEVL